MPLSLKIRYALCLALFLPATLSCSLLKPPELTAQEKERVAQKKKNYAALHEQVTSNNLKPGMKSEAIQALFGEPDDVFSSSSGVSTFEIWTYEKIMEGEDNSLNAIHLYIDNNKLISWRY